VSRRAAIVFLTCFVGLLVITATAKAAALLLLGHGNLEPHHGDGHNRVVGKGQIRFDGVGPERWALRFRRERQLVERLQKRLARQRYVLLHHSDVVEAINLAAATYGNGPELWRKAKCESGLNRYARNPASAASGLLQFLPSTFASTPYAGFDIFSPYANALAGGWMIANGRGNEWVCR
jgi:hypothetical protein